MFGVVFGNISQSFLQQEDYEDDVADLDDADFDLLTYSQIGELETSIPYDEYDPKGESSPSNDFLLEKYKKTIDYLYVTYYLIPNSAINNTNYSNNNTVEQNITET